MNTSIIILITFAICIVVFAAIVLSSLFLSKHNINGTAILDDVSHGIGYAQSIAEAVKPFLPVVADNIIDMTIPFASLKAQNGMKRFCSPWALFCYRINLRTQIHYRARGGECATLWLTVLICVPTAISSTNKCEFEHVNLSLYRLILVYSLAVSQCLHSQIFISGCVYAKNCLYYLLWP